MELHPTRTDVGALRILFTVEILMLTPPIGAFLLIPMVQMLMEEGSIVVCAQESEVTRIGEPNVIVVFAKLLL